MLTKYPLQFLNNLHTLIIKLFIENHNHLMPLEHIIRDEKIRRKWYPFRVKDTFQKYLLKNTGFFLHKAPFSHIFLVMHVYCYIWVGHPGGHYVGISGCDIHFVQIQQLFCQTSKFVSTQTSCTGIHVKIFL